MDHTGKIEEEKPPNEDVLENGPTPDELVGKNPLPLLLPSSCEGGDHFHDDDVNHSSRVTHQDFFDGKIQVISNVVFVIASAIYVAMEITVLPYYQFYKDVPYHIRETDNDEVWWQYYNETDAFPDYLYNATDDYTWMEWYNNSFFDENEINEFVFQVPKANRKYENPDEEYAAWVSQYMMLCFCAALGFLVTGVLEVSIARSFSSKIIYGIMVLAATLGILSSFFVNKDPDFSLVLNALSVHLFAFEAVSIVFSRLRSLKRMEREAMSKIQEQSKEGNQPHSLLDWIELDSCVGLPMMAWLGLGDISFFIGTSGDVVLSYFYIFEKDYLEHAIAAIITAVFWLLAALLYLGVASFELRRTKMRFHEAGLQEKRGEARKLKLILLALVVLATVVLVLGLVIGLDTSDEESILLEEGTFAPTDFSTDLPTDISTSWVTGETTGTQIPMGECNMTMSKFSQTTMMLTLAAMPSITTIDVQYAANALSKMYAAMIQNELGELKSSYCDPYCREISDVVVVETNSTNTSEASERQATECDTELKLTFRVEGTYWACEGFPFPGLFSDPMESDADALNMTGMMMMDNATCQVCTEGAISNGLSAPTSGDLLEAMEPHVAFLPAICDLQSAEVLDDNKGS